MKQKKINKKLMLNKSTLVNLDEMLHTKGGGMTEVFSCDTYTILLDCKISQEPTYCTEVLQFCTGPINC